MAIGGLVELAVGVKAERAELEDIAKPLTAQDAEQDEPATERSADRGGQVRRRRVGPAGRGGSSPGMAVSAPVTGLEFSREVQRIEQALAENGPTERRELARLVGARFWGPGRFPAALREAVESGRAKRIDRSRFGPAQ
jgi:hypothetical protein